MTSKFTTTRLLAAVSLAAALFVSSCSDSPSDLINYVPAESKVVAVANAGNLCQKAGLEKLLKKLNLRGGDKDEAEALMSIFGDDSGINSEKIVAYEYENAGYIAFIISDQKKFEKLELVSENTEKEKRDGFTIYSIDKTACIVVDGGTAWLAFGSVDTDDAVQAVKKFTSLDKDKSILSVPGFEGNMDTGDICLYMNMEELIGSVGSVSMSKRMINKELSRYGISADEIGMDLILESRIYMSCAIDKEKIALTAKVLDKDGKSIADKFMGGNTVDTDMLRFLDRNTTLVYAVALPDYIMKMYSKMAEENLYGDEQRAAVKQILDSLEGNVAVGVSLSGPLKTKQTYTDYYGEEMSYDTFNEAAFGVTVVAKGKSDMAAVVGQLASMLGTELQADGSILLPVKENVTFRIKADGKYLVASNRETPTSRFTDPGVFAGKPGAAVLNLSKNSTASKSISQETGVDFDLTAVCYSDKEKGLFEIKVNDNKEESALAYLIGRCVELAMYNDI